jgi:hypothetical protein
VSGEHSHPDLFDVAASLRADLVGMADRLNRLTAQVVALEAGQAALTEGLAAMATWHDYSGKPDGNLTIKAGDYVRVDVDVADPPRTGAAEFHMLYANCVPAWKSGEVAGEIRVKYVREDGDDTGYQSYTVHRDAVIGSPGRFLLSAQHFEVGQSGLGGRWWVMCGGGLSSITLTTRYCKILQVS